ncbi:MAG: TIGR03016 family PEP-CTERM system-associated outer membrane protein [Gammaproteobacteria bacterium]
MKIGRRQKRNNKGQLACVLLISVPGGPMALAAEWTIQPLLEVAETYSDNIALAPSGLEEDDFVTEINPGLLLRGAGRRLTLDLGYRLQNILFANNSDSNSTNHQLFANAAAELYREHLFLDASASVGQENFSDLGSRPSDNLSLVGDRGNVITYSISPYWRQRLRDLAEAQVRFTYDDVSGDNDDVSGSSAAVNASLTSGTRFGRWGWDLRYDRRDVSDEVEDVSGNAVDNDGGPDFATFDGEVSYRLTRQLGIVAAGGFENNDFASVDQDTDGVTWRIGANWRPSRNTQLAAFYGDRFFGSTWGMDLTHRSRRTTWSASYGEELEQTRNLLLDRSLFALADTPQELITNPIATDQVEEEELVQFSGNLPTFSNEVFLDKTFTAGVDIDFRRMTLSLRGFNTTREFQQSGAEEDQFGALAVLNRQLSRATTATVSLDWERIDFNDPSDRQDETGDFRIGILHQFGRYMSGIIDYRFLDRSSSEEESEFTENRIMGRLVVTL